MNNSPVLKVLLHSISNVILTNRNCGALSDMISFGFPLLAINLLRQSRNNGADNPLTISKCIARTARHVNEQITFFQFHFLNSQGSKIVKAYILERLRS